MKSEFPDAITFDAAGTLFSIAEPVGEVYSRIAASHRIAAAPQRIESAFRARFGQLPSPHAIDSPQYRKLTGHEAERRWWRSLVRGVFEKARDSEPLTETQFSPLFEDLFDHYSAPASWQLSQGILEVLSTLRQRTRLGVISNFDHRYHPIAEGLGLSEFFEVVVLSCEVRASKPAPAIFAAASRQLGLPPARILHIGDDPVCDVEGARNAGFLSYPPISQANPVSEIPSHFDFGR